MTAVIRKGDLRSTGSVKSHFLMTAICHLISVTLLQLLQDKLILYFFVEITSLFLKVVLPIGHFTSYLN